jgi:hypothetical protein
MERREFLKTGVKSAGVAAMLAGTGGATALLTGCETQETIASLTNTLGNAAVQIATIEGNTALATQLKADTAAAVAAITGWKDGGVVIDVIQALNIVEDDLNLFPVTDQFAPLIDLAIVTIESILALLPQSMTASEHGKRAHRTVKVSYKVPHKTKDFKSKWNQIVSDNSFDARAILK